MVEPPRRRSNRQLSDAEAAHALGLVDAGNSVRAVAERMGVTYWCISDLRRGRTYRHIARPPGLAALEARQAPQLGGDKRVEGERAGVAGSDDPALAAQKADLA